MGELWDMARGLDEQEARAKEFERRNAERLEAARKLSEQRAAEFIAHMRSKGVATLPLYARQVEPGGNWGNPPSRYFGYHFVGRGWLVRERNDDPDQLCMGRFLLENGQTYESWNVQERPQVGGLPMPSETPYVETLQDQIKGREDEFPAPMANNPYSTNEGGLMLAEALRRLGR